MFRALQFRCPVWVFKIPNFFTFSDSDVLAADISTAGQISKYEDNSAHEVSRRPLSEHIQGSYGCGGGAISSRGSSSNAPKRILRLSSPFTTFPSSALANSSVIGAPSSSCSTASTTDDPDQVQPVISKVRIQNQVLGLSMSARILFDPDVDCSTSYAWEYFLIEKIKW